MLLRRAAAPIALLAAVALGGCAAPEPEATPTASPTAEPLFASEEEALAAAEEVYAEYVRVADLVLSEGGTDPEQLEPLLAPELFEVQRQGFATARQEGLRSEGRTEFEIVEVQSYDATARPGARFLTAYVCRDLTNVNVLASDGSSVVAPDRVDVISQEVSWALSQDGDVLVESDEPWAGTTFC